MKKLVLFAGALVASPAAAEVKSATPAGFEVESRATVPVPPAEAYAALGRIGEWWNPAHTYSGKAANLRLDLKVGGCFCETTDGGGAIEHLRVIYAQPGAVLRLQGGLGPLQAEGVAGALTLTLKPVAGGTEIVQSYVVGGYVRGGAEALAPLVDKVMGEQLERYRSRLAGAR
ncbi:SRPBCC family protein [Sphingosinicella sp. LY1275]|uniref:SRPBCC family protein n=1 Tax=Sphingosinicella sp. LY1275 TaxID=3095379 RepID=UPI002ADEAC83|nr:SRPBCC family protein [Sphingosinicella sp. LY1275]MEA1015830.1 SRPBCC family protein [Sphingosinicella sp. LY1275]